MPSLKELLLVEITLTSFLTGLIWLVQIVHYPTYRFVVGSGFAAFQKFHQKSITWVVGPAMILELVAALGLLAIAPEARWAQLNLVGVALIWASTLFLSVPQHQRLEKARSEEAIEKLILTNWPRTLLWSGRLVLLGYVFLQNS